MTYHHYEVIGRRKPKEIIVDVEAKLKGEWKQPEEEEETKIYRMKIFAPNTVVAKYVSLLLQPSLRRILFVLNIRILNIPYFMVVEMRVSKIQG